MTFAPATLHLLCGKIASGKSTLAAELSAAPGLRGDQRGSVARRAL